MYLRICIKMKVAENESEVVIKNIIVVDIVHGLFLIFIY